MASNSALKRVSVWGFMWHFYNTITILFAWMGRSPIDPGSGEISQFEIPFSLVYSVCSGIEEMPYGGGDVSLAPY